MVSVVCSGAKSIVLHISVCEESRGRRDGILDTRAECLPGTAVVY